MRHLIPILAAFGLAACAGATSQLSADQCAANWGAVGAADGAEGESIAKLDDYAAACEAAGAPLSEGDRLAWRDGWRGGVGRFCDDPTGDADRQARVCPRVASTDPAFEDDDYEDDDDYRYGRPRIFPSVGVSVGSGGVRVGGGVGVGVGIFNLGVGF